MPKFNFLKITKNTKGISLIAVGIYIIFIAFSAITIYIIYEAQKTPFVDPTAWKCDKAKNWGLFVTVYQDSEGNKKYQPIEIWTDVDCSDISPASIGVTSYALEGWSYLNSYTCGALSIGYKSDNLSKFMPVPTVEIRANKKFSAIPSAQIDLTYHSYDALDYDALTSLFPGCKFK